VGSATAPPLGQGVPSGLGPRASRDRRPSRRRPPRRLDPTGAAARPRPGWCRRPPGVSGQGGLPTRVGAAQPGRPIRTSASLAGRPPTSCLPSRAPRGPQGIDQLVAVNDAPEQPSIGIGMCPIGVNLANDCDGCRARRGKGLTFQRSGCQDETSLARVEATLDPLPTIRRVHTNLAAGTRKNRLIVGTRKNRLIVGTRRNRLIVGTRKNRLIVGTRKNRLIVGTRRNRLIVGTRRNRLIVGTRRNRLIVGTRNRLIVGTRNRLIVGLATGLSHQPGNDLSDGGVPGTRCKRERLKRRVVDLYRIHLLEYPNVGRPGGPGVAQTCACGDTQPYQWPLSTVRPTPRSPGEGRRFGWHRERQRPGSAGLVRPRGYRPTRMCRTRPACDLRYEAREVRSGGGMSRITWAAGSYFPQAVSRKRISWPGTRPRLVGGWREPASVEERKDGVLTPDRGGVRPAGGHPDPVAVITRSWPGPGPGSSGSLPSPGRWSRPEALALEVGGQPPRGRRSDGRDGWSTSCSSLEGGRPRADGADPDPAPCRDLQGRRAPGSTGCCGAGTGGRGRGGSRALERCRWQ
jgi:hypothetical protein